jgi:hypothetical protein
MILVVSGFSAGGPSPAPHFHIFTPPHNSKNTAFYDISVEDWINHETLELTAI